MENLGENAKLFVKPSNWWTSGARKWKKREKMAANWMEISGAFKFIGFQQNGAVWLCEFSINLPENLQLFGKIPKNQREPLI